MKRIIVFILLIIFIFAGCNKKENKQEVDISYVREELAKYLESRICEDGSFDYLVNIDGTNTLDNYNLLRHSLSYWALLKYYEKDDIVLQDKKEIIKKGIDFIIPSIVYKNEDEAYLLLYDENEITLRKHKHVSHINLRISKYI